MIHSKSGERNIKYRINEITGNTPFIIKNFGIHVVYWHIFKLKALIEIIYPPKANSEDTPCQTPPARSKLKNPTNIIPTLPINPVIIPYLEKLVDFLDVPNLFDKK